MALSKVDEDFDDLGSGVAVARLERIPELAFPINEEGFEVYVEWGQRLLDAGLLDKLTTEVVTSLAVATHDLVRALNAGRSARYPMMQRDAALKKLNRLYADSSVSSADPSSNPYANFGFAKRARQRRHDHD